MTGLLVVGLVALTAVGAVAAWRDGRLNGVICGGECGPEYVIAPVGLRSAEPGDAGPDDTPASPELEAVLDRARGPLGAAVLGEHKAVAVAGTEPDGVIVATSDDTFIPASTTKLLTSFAALTVLDPQTRFDTRARLDGDRLVLVGGGDPYLTDERRPDDPAVVRADLKTLATETASTLDDAGITAVTLGYDDTLFTGPSVNPAWPHTYVRDNVVTPIGALWVDRGMVDTSRPETTPRIADPAAEARDTFAAFLRAAGIEVTIDQALRKAPDGARVVGQVTGSTVARIVESTIRTSDDEAAEVLLRHIAIAKGRPASSAEGAAVVVATLQDAGIDVGGLVLKDGSGLSRENRISPTTLVQVVRTSLTESRYAPVIDDLPVNGFSGTLAARYVTSTRGLVRAKTGTLTGVHALAGIVTDQQGRPVVFAAMADATDRTAPFGALSALDRIASAIAGR